MKTTAFTIAAAIAFTATSYAYAAPQSADMAPGDSVHIAMPKHTHMLAQNFKDYENSYLLENGRIIKFSQSHHHLYTQLEGEDKVEIYPVRHDLFMTDEGVQLSFRDDRDELVIDNYERLPMKVALKATGVTMASAR